MPDNMMFMLKNSEAKECTNSSLVSRDMSFSEMLDKVAEYNSNILIYSKAKQLEAVADYLANKKK